MSRNVTPKLRHVSQPSLNCEPDYGWNTTENILVRVGEAGISQEPILPGDTLVVRPQKTAALGDLVLLLSGENLVITRLTSELKGGPSEEILGRVVSALRQY